MDFDFEQLERAMVAWVQEHSDHSQSGPVVLDGKTNLLTSGLLDSVGFLDLITFAEELSGRTIDLAAIDPADLVAIAGLCRFLRSVGPADP